MNTLIAVAFLPTIAPLSCNAYNETKERERSRGYFSLLGFCSILGYYALALRGLTTTRINGLPTLSECIEEQPFLAGLVVVYLSAFICVRVFLVGKYTTASHVYSSSVSKETRKAYEKYNKKFFRLSIVSTVALFIYVTGLILIPVVPVSKYLISHVVVTTIAISFGIINELCLAIRRYYVHKIHERRLKFVYQTIVSINSTHGEDEEGTFGHSSCRSHGLLQLGYVGCNLHGTDERSEKAFVDRMMMKQFGYTNWRSLICINFLVVLIVYVLACVFLYFSVWGPFDWTYTSSAALSEYALLHFLVMMTFFHILDIYCHVKPEVGGCH